MHTFAITSTIIIRTDHYLIMSYPRDTYHQNYLQQQNILNQSYLQGNKTKHPISPRNTQVSSQPRKGPKMPHGHVFQIPNYGLNPSFPTWTPHQGQCNYSIHVNKRELNSYDKASSPWPHYSPVPANGTNFGPQIWANHKQLNGSSSTSFPAWKKPDNDPRSFNNSLTKNTNSHLQDPSHHNLSNWDPKITADIIKPNARPTFGPPIGNLNTLKIVNNINIPFHIPVHLPPPPLPKEEPPPPPPPFPLPPPPPALPLNNTTHHNAAGSWAKWNLSNIQQIHTTSQVQYEKKDVNFDKQLLHKTVQNSSMPAQNSNDETKQNKSQKNKSYSCSNEKNTNSNPVTLLSEEDCKFVDALSELQGLSKQWTTAPNSPNSFRRTRNQKKKDKKRQKRKEERFKLMELIKEPDHEDLSDFECFENTSDRGYQLSELRYRENRDQATEYNTKRNEHFSADEETSTASEKDKVEDEEMEISDGDEIEITRDYMSKQQFEDNRIHSSAQESPVTQEHKYQTEVSRTLDISPSKQKSVGSNPKKSKILKVAGEVRIEKVPPDEPLDHPSTQKKSHLSLSDDQTGINEVNRDLMSHSPKKPIGPNACEESLTEKRERLARALKRIALEKAKVKLKMAQKKRQEILAHSSSIQLKSPVNDITMSSTPSNIPSNIIHVNVKNSKLPPESCNLTPGKNQRIDKKLKLCDITAYRTSHLVIRNINSSGPQEKVRVNANKTFCFVSTDEEHVTGDQTSVQDGRDSKENVSNSIELINKTHEKISSCKSTSPTSILSGPSSHSKHSSDTQMKTESIKQNLQLLKSRLRLKLMEKARLERKRKFNSEGRNDETPKKEFKKDYSEFSCQEGGDKEVKEENVNLKLNSTDAESSDNIIYSESPLTNSTLNVETSKFVHVMSKIDAESKEHDNMKNVIGGETVKKKIVSLLKERQRILKDNIDSSKINQRELKYNMDISSLNILVNRQKQTLAKQGEKIAKKSSLIKECCKELNEHKQSIAVSEKRINELQKRKRIMEKMLLTVTKKLIDGRKSRNELSILMSRSKRKKTIHPDLERPRQEFEESNI